MTDLPFDFSETLDAFECPEQIQAYEKQGSYVNGYWTETAGTKRSVRCILLNVDERTLEIVAQGRNVDTGYCVMIPEDEDEFFVAYQQNGTIQGKQTYFVIDGLDYVIVKNPETVKNAGFRSYFALRFKEGTNVQ